MPRRPLGSAPFAPGGRSSAGPSWHGLARRGGWFRFATCGSGGGSPARSARRITARPRAAPPRAAIGAPIATPASFLCPPMWQWAKVVEVSAARVAAAREAAAMGLAVKVARAVERAVAVRGRAA
eukprot:scaffold92209_cov45-Phaeocystis_antarctica.AAC.1